MSPREGEQNPEMEHEESVVVAIDKLIPEQRDVVMKVDQEKPTKAELPKPKRKASHPPRPKESPRAESKSGKYLRHQHDQLRGVMKINERHRRGLRCLVQ